MITPSLSLPLTTPSLSLPLITPSLSLTLHNFEPPGLIAEELELCSDRNDPQGWIPLRVIYSNIDQEYTLRRPVVIFIHPEGRFTLGSVSGF